MLFPLPGLRIDASVVSSCMRLLCMPMLNKLSTEWYPILQSLLLYLSVFQPSLIQSGRLSRLEPFACYRHSRLCVTAGLFDVSLNMLDAWTQQHAVSQPPAEGAPALQEVPRWIDALLLCLDMGMQPQPAPQTQPEQPQSNPAADPSTTPSAQAAAAASSSAPAADAARTPATASAPEGAAASAGSQEAAGASSTAQAEGSKEEPPVAKSVEERQQAATQMLRDNIKTMFLPNGVLSQQQLERAASICMKLLQHLHAWGSVWKVPDPEPSESDVFSRPQPASSTQAVVQVLARVTKSHKVALKVSLACTWKTQPVAGTADNEIVS